MDGLTDGGDCITSLANAVGNNDDDVDDYDDDDNDSNYCKSYLYVRTVAIEAVSSAAAA